MANRPVHWHEGMFLGPQHLQADQRYQTAQRHKYARAAHRYYWGLQSLELNPLALANNRFEIRSLRAFLRDGTLIDLPEDGPIPRLDLAGPLSKVSPLTVYLAVPTFRTGRANAAEPGQAPDVRYLVDMQDVEDENTGADPQRLKFRLMNSRLFATQLTELPGYDAIPLAVVGRSADAEPTPKIDLNYIPPLLGCDAWNPLQIGIIRNIYDRIGTKIDILADQVTSRGISLESHAAEDTRIMGQLRALNEAYTVLGNLAFAEGIHPLDVYIELCRIVGQLCIFDKNPRPPEDIPRYDHDKLGHCFYTVKRYIDMLLNIIVEPEWVARPFIGVGERLQVSMEPIWLEATYDMYIGITSSLPADECNRLFTTRGMIDMKIGSSDRVDQLYQEGRAGLLFAHKVQPRSLPVRQGLTYFQVDKASRPVEFDSIKRTLTVAVRLNKNYIEGDIDGKTTVTIRHQHKQVPVSLTLYVTKSQTPGR